MNTEQYKKALSGVRPSEQCMERIIAMSKKPTRQIKKGWIIALAAALILLCALFTANAATDGAILNGQMFQSLIIRFNGKETRLSDYDYIVEETTDENGEPVVKYSFDLPDGKKIEAYAAEDYSAFAMDADGVESIQTTTDQTE